MQRFVFVYLCDLILGVQRVKMVATVQEVARGTVFVVAGNGGHRLEFVFLFGIDDDDVDLEEVDEHRCIEVVAVMALVVNVGSVLNVVFVVDEAYDGVDVGQCVRFHVGSVQRLLIVWLEPLVKPVDHAT